MLLRCISICVMSYGFITVVDVMLVPPYCLFGSNPNNGPRPSKESVVVLLNVNLILFVSVNQDTEAPVVLSMIRAKR